jgi:hypothetical protein
MHLLGEYEEGDVCPLLILSACLAVCTRREEEVMVSIEYLRTKRRF